MMLNHQGSRMTKPDSPSSSSEAGSIHSSDDGDCSSIGTSPPRQPMSSPVTKCRYASGSEETGLLEQNVLNNNFFYRPPFPPSMFSTPDRHLLQLSLQGSYNGFMPNEVINSEFKKRKLCLPLDRLSDDDGAIDTTESNSSIDKDGDLSMRTTDSSPDSTNSVRTNSPFVGNRDSPILPSCSPNNANTSESNANTMDLKRKSRTNYTPEQVQKLEKEFHENPYPDSDKMEAISKDLGVPEGKIKVWFQNKRARWRRRIHDSPRILPPFLPPMMSPLGTPYGYLPGGQMIPASSAAIQGQYFGFQSLPSPTNSTASSSPQVLHGNQQNNRVASPFQRGQYTAYGFYPYPYGVLPSPYF